MPGCEPRGITHGAKLRFIAVNDGPGEVGSPPRCDQDEKRWVPEQQSLARVLSAWKTRLEQLTEFHTSNGKDRGS